MSYKPGQIVNLKFNGNYKTADLKTTVNGKHPVLIINIFSNNRIRIASMQLLNSSPDKIKHVLYAVKYYDEKIRFSRFTFT